MKTVRGVLRPAFQMAVDDDCLQKNPFGFELAGVVVNDSVTREAITRDQMRKFLKFVHDDNCYCKYYEAVYILFHTGMRISEFCGLTIHDLDMENRIIDINHQLQRSSAMEYYVESTKTNSCLHVSDSRHIRFTSVKSTSFSHKEMQTYGYILRTAGQRQKKDASYNYTH